MKRRLARALPALFLLVGVFCPVRAQESSLLLGVRFNEPIPEPLPYFSGDADSLVRPAYRTLLFTKRGETVSLIEHPDDLVVPDGNRFWQIGTKRSVYNNWVEDFVWSAPYGERPSLPGIQTYNGEYCEGHRSQTIHYVGPDYIGLEQVSTGYCEDGTHPWFFNTYAFVPIDSTMHLGLPISRVLGQNARKVMEEANDRFLAQIEDEEQRSLYFQEPDEANWMMKHHSGRWNVLCRLDVGGVADGSYTDLPLNIYPPARLTGPSALTPDWDAIKQFAPDAIDAFTSPEKDLLIIFHPTAISAHLLKDGKIGPERLVFHTGQGTTAVMARWSSGSEVERWSRFFAQTIDRNAMGTR